MKNIKKIFFVVCFLFAISSVSVMGLDLQAEMDLLKLEGLNEDISTSFSNLMDKYFEVFLLSLDPDSSNILLLIEANSLEAMVGTTIPEVARVVASRQMIELAYTEDDRIVPEKFVPLLVEIDDTYDSLLSLYVMISILRFDIEDRGTDLPKEQNSV